jgi:hypothetical protein
MNKHHIILGDFDHRKDMLRLQPPLVVQKEEIDHAIEALDEACSKSSIGLALDFGRTALEGWFVHQSERPTNSIFPFFAF